VKIVQTLPELNGGGVERGTVELAAFLVRQGHESIVISHGGRMVTTLEQAGSRHITLPVHRKNPLTLFQVPALRRFLTEEKPDILHIRSRAPGWVAWLAWRGMDPATRPHLVSTVHGFYSVNRYSAVMTRGERVIAVSHSIRDSILKNYPQTRPDIIRVIPRGVSPDAFPRGFQPDSDWLSRWQKEHPQLSNKQTILLPGRLTRWKGHEDFLALIARLRKSGLAVHGLVAGEAHARKPAYLGELHELARTLGIESDITFLGHRSDLREVMSVSDLVLSLSSDPEAFGRVSLEAMALGVKTAGYDHGGVAEQLADLFPQGRVAPGDLSALSATCRRLLASDDCPASVDAPYTLDAMCRSTLAVYQELVTATRTTP
jgi:glycosyltransferase involved in cell wall biosynthesis